MADPGQLALIKTSVQEWNKWREAHPYVRVDLSGADLSGADLREANLTEADLREANLYKANINVAFLRGADFTRANLRGATIFGTVLTGVKGFYSPTPSQTQSSQSSSTTNWLSLVKTYGSALFVAAATLASIIQGLDVIERRWREKKEKQKQQSAQAQPSSASSIQSAASSSHKTPDPDGEITEIRLVMDDGSPHSFKRWISDPDELRTYIDAFSDPTSKVKPLQVTFMKREGRSLVVDITKGGKDNPQLNVILGYLEAE